MQTAANRTADLITELADPEKGLQAKECLKALYTEKVNEIALQYTGSSGAAKAITERFFRILWIMRDQEPVLAIPEYIGFIFLQALTVYISACHDNYIHAHYDKATKNAKQLKDTVNSIALL